MKIKITIGILLMSLFLTGISHGQSGGNAIDTSSKWTWMNGENGTTKWKVDAQRRGATGNPEKMVKPPALGNHPGTIGDAVYWKDTLGRLYTFGGHYNQANTYNQVWRIDPKDSTWTWMHGDKDFASSAAKGKLVSAAGVPHPDNIPETRSGATFAVDNIGCVWVFGGYDNLTIKTWRNDFWRYNPYENEWTYFGGSTLRKPLSGTSYAGVYGTKGVAQATNQPGSRGYNYGASWIDDKEGKFYLFSGTGVGTNASKVGYVSDFWVFDMKSSMWTWIGGGDSITTSLMANYGTKGVAAASNFPQPRSGASTWKDKTGNFYMFGGGVVVDGATFQLNDMWKYDPKAGMWTWISGDKISTTNYHMSAANSYGTYGVYGNRGEASATNYPGGRSLAGSWVDESGNFWLVGGYGLAESPDFLARQNDMWKYNPSTNEWIWMNGSKIGAADQRGTAGNYLTGWQQGGQPGGRSNFAVWADKQDNVWVYGGYGGGTTAGVAFRSDVWLLEAMPQSSATSKINIAKLDPKPDYCKDDKIKVAYETKETFNTTNIFTAQLSDKDGSFAQATNIGTFKAMASGIIDATIPSSVIAGNKYRIRVVSSSPLIIGADNGEDFMISVLDPLFKLGSTPSNGIVCEGEMVTLFGDFKIIGINPPTTYQWDKGVVNGKSFQPPAGTTIYNVTARAGACIKTGNITVKVNPLPKVSATANPKEICEGEKVTLKGSGATKYEWDNGVQDGVAFSPSQTAAYVVKGIDDNGCTNEATLKVAVNPAPKVTATASPSAVCAGDQLTLKGGGAATYIWNNNVTDNKTFIPKQTTTYTVKGTDRSGCNGEAKITVTVNPLPNVTAKATPDSVCVGGQITLQGAGATIYTWDNNVVDNTPFIPKTSTSYSVTGKDANNCSNTAKVIVTVKDTFEVKIKETICKEDTYILGTQKLNVSGIYQEIFAASNGCDSTVILDLKINIVDVSVSFRDTSLFAVAGMDSYQWLDCDKENELIRGANKKNYTPGKEGNYAVIVSKDGCVDTSACYEYQVTGINGTNALSKNITIYPNPVQNQVSIKAGTALKNADIRLSNTLGQTLLTQRGISGDLLTIDVTKLASGIYFIELIENQKIFRAKIMKK